jgi:hypothetical protein
MGKAVTDVSKNFRYADVLVIRIALPEFKVANPGTLVTTSILGFSRVKFDPELIIVTCAP